MDTQPTPSGKEGASCLPLDPHRFVLGMDRQGRSLPALDAHVTLLGTLTELNLDVDRKTLRIVGLAPGLAPVVRYVQASRTEEGDRLTLLLVCLGSSSDSVLCAFEVGVSMISMDVELHAREDEGPAFLALEFRLLDFVLREKLEIV